MSDSDAPPAFEDPFEGADAEQQIYGTVLQTREPTTAKGFADRVGCDPKTARKYLQWFADLGIVTAHEGRPVTYERNDAYFEWRRIDQLAEDNTLDELRQRVSDLTEKIRAYERRYGSATPGEVDALAVSDEKGVDIDRVYGDLGDWATARQDRRLYERARQQRAESVGGERASG